MLFSQTVEYALRAVVWLADNPRQPHTTGAIADATRVPAGYLSKVLQGLGRAGIVTGQRGLGGGFTLACDPEVLTLLDVINAVDPIQRIRTCPLGLESHSTTLCPLHRHLDDALAQIEQTFGNLRISDMLTTPGRNKPLCDVPIDAVRIRGRAQPPVLAGD